MKNKLLLTAFSFITCASSALAVPPSTTDAAQRPAAKTSPGGAGSKTTVSSSSANHSSTATMNASSSNASKVSASVKSSNAARVHATASSSGAARVHATASSSGAAKIPTSTTAGKSQASAKNSSKATAVKSSTAKTTSSPKSSGGVPATVAKDGSPIWLDVKTAKLASKLKNKPILADFYTDWCHWCQVMDRTTYLDPEVQKKLSANYVCMKVNAQDGGDGQELATRFGVAAFPTTLVILSTGKPLAVAEGYRDRVAFLHFLDAVSKLPKTK